MFRDTSKDGDTYFLPVSESRIFATFMDVVV